MTDDEKKIEEPEVTPDPLNTPASAPAPAPEEKPKPAPEPTVSHEKETIHEIRYMDKPEKKKGSKLKIIGVLLLILLIGVVAVFATLNVTMYAP